MAVEYVIHKEQRLVLTIGRGRVTFDELLAHRRQLLRDPNFDRTFDQLNDYCDTTSTDISRDNVQVFASSSVFSPASRRAVVVLKPQFFGIARQFEAYHGERANVRVFYEWESALKWLELSEISSLFSAGRSQKTEDKGAE